MNKTFRILLVLVLLAGIILAAGSKAAWATPAAKQAESASPKANSALPTFIPPVGSVRPPDCRDATHVKQDNIKNICGVVLITGLSNADVFAFLNPIPEGFYSQAVTLYFTSGSVQICFAAPDGGTIFFRASGTTDVWVTVPTNVLDGFACAIVSANGEYALGPIPAPTPAP